MFLLKAFGNGIKEWEKWLKIKFNFMIFFVTFFLKNFKNKHKNNLNKLSKLSHALRKTEELRLLIWDP